MAPEPCRRCARRHHRTGDRRRRCASCREALGVFKRAARILIDLQGEPGGDPDAAPVLEAFRPWLYVTKELTHFPASYSLSIVDRDPEGWVLTSRPWARL